MGTEALHDWLARFDALMEEMAAQHEPQALMVASVMMFLRGSIASLGEGDERLLARMSSFALETSRALIAEHHRLEEERPS